MEEYIYLLQEREFKNAKQPVYKIGKTKQKHNKRFEQYPKGSILLFQTICRDCDYFEKKILELFDNTFKKRTDLGNEYYEGDYIEMIKIIFNTIEFCKDLTIESATIVEAKPLKIKPVKIKKLVNEPIKNIEPVIETIEPIKDEYGFFNTKRIDKIDLSYFYGMNTRQI